MPGTLYIEVRQDAIMVSTFEHIFLDMLIDAGLGGHSYLQPCATHRCFLEI